MKGVVDIGEISLGLQDFGPESTVCGTGYACKVDRLASSAEVEVALGRQRQHAATTRRAVVWLVILFRSQSDSTAEADVRSRPGADTRQIEVF